MFQVVIVGRPNVGKSTLFNRLCGTRKSIVGDEPGITRDRIYGTLDRGLKPISILDTGGLLPATDDVIPAAIIGQVEAAVRESDLILFVVDGRAGITALDEQLFPVMRKTGKSIFIIVNKIDSAHMEMNAAPFYAFGAEMVFPVSAEHNLGIGDLIDVIVEKAPDVPDEPEQTGRMEIKIAVVGRPNVGKSSLVNRLVGFERSIVTDMPGTTRDAVDTLIEHDGTYYRIIDTAGIRRKGKTEGMTEKISVIMAKKSLKASDVALLLLDAGEGVTKLDAAIGGYACDSGCSVIIVLNKWDLVDKDSYTLEKFSENIRRKMKYLAYAPIVTVSALTGQRVSRLFDLICRAHEARRITIPTGTLNNMFVPGLTEEFAARNQKKKLGIRYISQVRSNPPVFVVFNAGRDMMHFSTERYLTNRLREQFGFFATPIRIRQRNKSPGMKRTQDPKL
ncbi:MAG TPA: ribosome biogenesis GTPase Der [Acidobacteriota bacterium]|nr:ribosome biogenesis GTPase Der [Acidobacteriota bacterium]